METLVLNVDYRPLYPLPAAEAVVELLKGRAELVESYDDRFVFSAGQVWAMPSIIRFLTRASSWGYHRKGIKFSRQNIWVRDRGECQYCGSTVKRSEFTYDHVIPRAQKGTTVWENIVVCCIPCNQKKRARTPEQAKMTLRHRPYRPRSLPGVSADVIAWTDKMPESWRQFVTDVSYWHGKLDEG